MLRRPNRLAAPLFLVLMLVGSGLEAAVEAPRDDVARLKALQRQILLREPAERMEKLERFRAWRKQAARRGGSRVRRPSMEGPGDLIAGGRADFFAGARPAAISAIGAVANRLVNDPSGDTLSTGVYAPGSCQSEVSIASHNNYVVAAWNDGIGIYDNTDVQGYGYSVDGGLTWVDGGVPPTAGIGLWASDPVVTVDDKTGAFYYCGLTDQALNSTNGIGIVKGTFTGSNFAWGAPVPVVTVSYASALIDKEWVVADSSSGRLYVSYTYFDAAFTTDEIRFQRSSDGGLTWGSPQTLSAAADAGNVQGSRPAVGPGGEVYVVWHAIGASNTPPFFRGPDYLRIRKSTNGGVSFGTEATAADLYSNFGSGGPGFNRGLGITFPGIAVDRSQGPYRGRVYVSWSEGVNFIDDYYPRTGVDPAQSEIESNNGTLTATPFAPGAILRGTVALGNDLDYWKWRAVQGQTYAFWLDSLASTLDASMRVFCSDGATNPSNPTNLAFSQNGTGGQDFILFTAPATDTYYLRVASYRQMLTGKYRVLSTTHSALSAGRARDQRDVFAASSDNSVTWSPAARVNDSPAYFDDFLPEVVVDGVGRVFSAAYDWRDAPSICGGGSNVYLYRSDDGGSNWGSGTRITDYTTNWTSNYSTLIPNQGDYIGLYARDTTVFMAWADGRGVKGDPDIYMATTALSCVYAPVAVVGAVAAPESVVVTWAATNGFAAELFRREDNGTYVDLGPIAADVLGQIVYVDRSVNVGRTYAYRLGVTGFCQPFAGEVSVKVAGPFGPQLAILNAWPNPARDDLNISFVLEGPARPATLALHDISGREVARRDLTGEGPYVVSLTQGVKLPPGMYFVRLTQGKKTKSRRVSIFP